MEQRKRRVSIRKILQTLVTFLLVGLGVFALQSANRIEKNKTLSGLHIKIFNQHEAGFINEAYAQELLFGSSQAHLNHLRLDRLNLNLMEQKLQSNPWISRAEVYADNEHKLFVHIWQRIPEVRLFTSDGNSYFLDKNLKEIPLSEHYSPLLPVVTNVPQLKSDSSETALRTAIFKVVSTLQQHPFWNAQIAQIAVVNNREFELVPVLGRQRILLGDTSLIHQKLENLLAFYQQVQNKIGWDKYTTIDLRYKDQVVASPALKWKAPVDRALNNIDWIKAVLGDAGAAATNLSPALPNTVTPN